MTAALTHAGEQRIICAMSSYPADLTGKLVYLERENPADKNDSYYDGEYLVLHASASSLNVFSTADFGVYGLGGGLVSSAQKALVGEGRYLVVSVADPNRGWISDQLDEAEAEIEAVRSGVKKAGWIESVYSRAEATIHRIRRTFSPFSAAAIDGVKKSEAAPSPPEQVKSCFDEARRLLHEAELPPGKHSPIGCYNPDKVHLALQWRDLGSAIAEGLALCNYL